MRKLNAQAFRRIGASETVIKWIEEGVPLPFKNNKPPEDCELPNRIKSQKEYEFVDSEIKKLTSQHVLIPVIQKPKCVLPISCVPKKGGKSRLVLDCRHINESIQCPSFSQEGITAVQALIEEDDNLFTVDLKNGFYHVNLKKESRTYMGIKWNNQYFVWAALAFGVSIALYYFNKIVRPMIVFLRENNIRIAPFVDDFLNMCRPSQFTDNQDFVLKTLDDLGWQINVEKSVLIRSKSATFVGFIISTDGERGPWIKVLPCKVYKLHRAIVNVMTKQTVTARSLACVTGQCVAMTKAIVPGKLLLRNVYRVLASRDNWDTDVTLTKQAMSNLNWWLSAIKGWNGAPLRNHTSIEVQLQTDTSTSGWGGTTLQKDAAGIWPTSVQFQHSNYRELLAVYMSLQSLVDDLKGKSVQILSDNVTTVAYINRLGGGSELMSNLMTTIWSFAQNHNIQLTAQHLASILNGRADGLSRVCSPYEWKLNKKAFNFIDALWGPHTIDRFAAVHNHQVKRYNSLYWDPNTEAIDALAQNWKQENNFVNPPFWLLPRVLNLIVEQQVEATVIAPVWRGQVWFKQLQELSVCQPLKLKLNQKMILQKGNAIPEPLKNPSWTVCAWRLHGNRNLPLKDGLKEQRPFLWQTGQNQHYKCIIDHLKNWQHTVQKEVNASLI